MKETRRPRKADAAAPHGTSSPIDAKANAAACCDLGRDSLLAGDVNEAIWYLRQAVENDTECVSAWQLLGRCFEEMGEQVRARRCFTLAFRLFLKRTPDAAGALSEPLPIIWPAREPRDS